MLGLMGRVVIREPGGERGYELKDGTTTFGRAPENDVKIADKEFSRRHFQIQKFEGGYKLVDLESRNGSRVNGKTVNQHLLRPGDRIEIGQCTIVFEDPNFREPSAAVAAAFKPPTASVPILPPPPSTPRPPTSPVPRVERRASGNTTAVERRREAIYQREERRTLAIVGWLGGGFVGLIVILIVVGSVTRESADVTSARDTIARAQKLEVTKPLEALSLYDSVGPSAGEALHRQAKERAAALREQMGGSSEKRAEGPEQQAFDAIVMLQKNSPQKVDEITKLCEDFKAAYPSSKMLADVETYLKRARDEKAGARKREVDELAREVDAAIKSQQYRQALQATARVHGKYKDDIELRQQIEKLQERAVQEGRKYANEQLVMADLKQKNGDPSEAKQMYLDLIAALGGVYDFDDQVRIAKVKLEALK